MSIPKSNMRYGTYPILHQHDPPFLTFWALPVRLGKSGLKVSKIILGCMSYGSPEFQSWSLPEEEAIKHIKFAYVRLCCMLPSVRDRSHVQR